MKNNIYYFIQLIISFHQKLRTHIDVKLKKNLKIALISISAPMEKDLRLGHRSSYFSGGGCMMSPSCLPVVHDEFQYSRIPQNCVGKRSRGWRNLLRKLMRESKTFYGSKPPSFQYDPVSYSQNFDDGSHPDQPTRLSFVFQDVRDAALDRLKCRCKV